MSFAQRDYIMRMIEQLAEAMRNIAGLREAGLLAEADDQLRQTSDAMFGPLADMVDRLDAASATMLLSHPDKLAAYAAVTHERARLIEARGEPQAPELYRRALALYAELAATTELNRDARAAVSALIERLGEGAIPNHRRALVLRAMAETS